MSNEISSETRKWALNNLGRAMKDLENNTAEYDENAIMSIKAALANLGE